MIETQALLHVVMLAAQAAQYDTFAAGSDNPFALRRRESAHEDLRHAVASLVGIPATDAHHRAEAVIAAVRQAARSLELRWLIGEIQITD